MHNKIYELMFTVHKNDNFGMENTKDVFTRVTDGAMMDPSKRNGRT